MVRYLIIFLLASTISGALTGQELSTALVFEERVFNFGTIQEKDGKVSHTFYFKNNSKSSVTIGSVNTGCGCIGEVTRKGPIKPGERATLAITFDPAYKVGFFSKEIFIFSDNGTRYNHVWVEGNITAAAHPVENDYPYNFGSDLHLRYKVMAFGEVKPGASKKMELPFANNSNKAMKLVFVPRSNRQNLFFTNPGTIPANSKGSIVFNYRMPFNQQDVAIQVDVYVNDKKLPEPLLIKVLRQNSL